MESAAGLRTTHAGVARGSPPRVVGHPVLPSTYIRRQRLWRRLDTADVSSVTVLVAPAGAGKTLGVAGWLELHRGAHRRQCAGQDAPVVGADGPDLADAAWVSASRPTETVRLTAQICDRSRLLDTVDGAPAGDRGARASLVVVDDAHRLPSTFLSLLEEELVRHPQHLHLLLLSRRELSFNALAAELQGHLTVVRGSAVRLDDAEAMALAQMHAGTDDPAVVAGLAERARGWCAPLVLEAREVAARGATFLSEGDGDSASASRIAEEAFDDLPARHQHLLMCVAAEDDFDVAGARHLSSDPRAASVVAELGATGLLVHELPRGDRPGDRGARFRVHHLVAQAARARLAGAGLSARRARAAVVRAVQSDRARGLLDHAFRRLVAVGEHDLAASLMVTDGIDMVLAGDGDRVIEFVRACPEVIADTPRSWFAVLTQRWLEGDLATARHWSELCLDHHRLTGCAEPVELACIGLLRARMGLEAMAAAVSVAREVVSASQSAGSAAFRLLLLELAATLNWLGDLDEAEAHLGTAIALCRAYRPSCLEAVALSHLAISEYMQGRERACREVAVEAIGVLGEPHAGNAHFVLPTAAVGLLLAGLAEPPWQPAISSPWHLGEASVHGADLVTRFWLRIRDASLALTRGDAVGAGAELERPLALPGHLADSARTPLPRHLALTWYLHRGLIARLTSDVHSVRCLADEVDRLGFPGDGALLQGLAADMGGDVTAARGHFGDAASRATCTQPPVAELALVCGAQVDDAMGDHVSAVDQLALALARTEVRRTALPFLGWTSHGTPMGILLGHLVSRAPSPWLRTLADATIGGTDVVEHYATSVVTPAERQRLGTVLAAATTAPVLSPRERDVLHDLARGSTYADIAANLTVAESTVKSHVSSLYAKLGASRRSEALAIARAARLL